MLMPMEATPAICSVVAYSAVEIVTFHLRKNADFNSAIAQIHDYMWYSLVSGGTTKTYVLVLPHGNWADFEDKPDVKPFRDMLKEAFGQAETDSIVNRIDVSVETETSE